MRLLKCSPRTPTPDIENKGLDLIMLHHAGGMKEEGITILDSGYKAIDSPKEFPAGRTRYLLQERISIATRFSIRKLCRLPR